MRIRRFLAVLARIVSPGYSWCRECGMPWKFTKEHVIRYDRWSGIFFTCESCWPKLSVEERVAYAHQVVYGEWSQDAWDKWPAIELAVREAS
jgi:hypothetical protein